MQKRKDNGAARGSRLAESDLSQGTQGAAQNCHGKVPAQNCRRRKRNIATCVLAAMLLLFLVAAAACAKNGQPKQITLSFDAVLLQYTESEVQEALPGTLSEEEITPISVMPGEISAKDLPVPAPREGYRFLYWSTSPDGAEALRMEEDGTLFAVWQPLKFTSVATEAEFLAMEPDGKYLLTADFSVSAQYSGSFAGIFDGAGHTVTLTGSSASLFFENAGVIRRLNLVGEAIGNRTAAGLAIYNMGRVESCSFTGKVTSEGISGGLVASNSGYMAYVRFSGNVCGKTVAGGIVGRAVAGKMAACRADGEMVLTAQNKGSLGGVAGEITFDHRDVYYTLSYVSDCAFFGTLRSETGDAETMVGGVAGRCSASYLWSSYADFTATVGEKVYAYGIAAPESTVSVYGKQYPPHIEVCGFAYGCAVSRAGHPSIFYDKDYRKAEGYVPEFSTPQRTAFLLR